MNPYAIILALAALVQPSPDPADARFVLVDKVPVVDPLAIDIYLTEGVRPEGCSVSADIQFTTEYACGGQNSRVNIRVSGRDEIIRSFDNVCGARGTISCDPAHGSFYFGHPYKGTIHALDSSGSTLWETSIPGFDPTRDHVSVLHQVNGHLLVQTRRREAGSFHSLLSPAGDILDHVGPWDGLLSIPRSTSAWILFAGGGIEYNSFVPKYRVTVDVGSAASGYDSLADVSAELTGSIPSYEFDASRIADDKSSIKWHMVAFLTPLRRVRVVGTEFCAGSPKPEDMLGASFNARHSMLARFTLMENDIGMKTSTTGAWFSLMSESEPLRSVVSRWNPVSNEWIAEYQEALMQVAGSQFDAWLARSREKR